MSVLLQDSFTGTNGTDLTAHTMDVGTGWFVAFGVIQLNGSGRAAQQSETSSKTLYYSPTSATNGTISGLVKKSGLSSNVALVARYTNSTNYVIGRLNHTSIDIIEVIAGSPTNRATAPLVSFLGDYLVSFSVSGAAANLFVSLSGFPATNASCHCGTLSNKTGTSWGLYADATPTSGAQWASFNLFQMLPAVGADGWSVYSPNIWDVSKGGRPTN